MSSVQVYQARPAGYRDGERRQLELYHRSTGGRQPKLHGQGHRQCPRHHHHGGGDGDVDTTAPSETISATIGTNTGSTTTITSGGLTHDNTLALSGTVSDTNGVSSVQVYDGATLLGTATVSAGSWSYHRALADGSHSFTAKATDNAGNTTTTAAVTATVDTTAPSETISATIGTNTVSTTTITSGG